jgi:hypothetical protein
VSDFKTQYGPWALVAGASAGIGAAFAQALAARGLNVVLLARRQEALAELAAALEKEHGVQARYAALDLGRADLWDAVRPLVEDVEVGLFVHVAAHSTIGPFLSERVEQHLRVLDVNCRGPLVLGHALGREMAKRKRGGIVLMTSLAATQGGPWIATYAASKAFGLVLAEGLWAELAREGVHVVACRAGATRTPGYESSNPVGKTSLMEPEPVAESALAALGRGPSVVPGWLNRFAAVFMGRIAPRRTAVRIMGGATSRIYANRLGRW